MAIKTSTLASIYEMQGHNEEAKVMYEEILKLNPHNKEAALALMRLSQHERTFHGVNTQKLALFRNATSSNDYYALEQWLLGDA